MKGHVKKDLCLMHPEDLAECLPEVAYPFNLRVMFEKNYRSGYNKNCEKGCGRRVKASELGSKSYLVVHPSCFAVQPPCYCRAVRHIFINNIYLTFAHLEY